MKSDIRAIIEEFGRLPIRIENLGDSDNLYDAGLTSFASVQLMLALEDRFNVEIPTAMLNRRTFASINAIAAAIAEVTSKVT